MFIKIRIKGAPEAILERCSTIRLASDPTKSVPLTDQLRSRIGDAIYDYGTTKSLRCLALAVVENAGPFDRFNLKDPKNYLNYEQEMTFIGLVGMSDPPRPEIRQAVQTCRTAGIRVIVITGDNKSTAESICRLIGVFGEDEDLTGKSYTGREWDQLSKREKVEVALRANLFSRTEPTHKSELVDALQNLGFVVAMVSLLLMILLFLVY